MLCVQCGAERELGRKLCRACFNVLKASRRKERRASDPEYRDKLNIYRKLERIGEHKAHTAQQKEMNPKPVISQKERYRSDPIFRAKRRAQNASYRTPEYKQREKERYIRYREDPAWVEKARISSAIYRHAHPDEAAKVKSAEARDKRVAEAADGTLTGSVIRGLFYSAKQCPYCGDPFTKSRKSLDHIVPLSKGGTHGLANVLICCYECNRKKQCLSLTEWLLRLKRRMHSSHAKRASVPSLF